MEEFFRGIEGAQGRELESQLEWIPNNVTQGLLMKSYRLKQLVTSELTS